MTGGSGGWGHLPVEPVAALVLSAAGVLTSWSHYQASLWDGAQMAHYSRAGAHRTEASREALDASLTRAVEVNLFRSWIEAKSKGDDRLAGFYEARFPPALRAAFPAWLALRPLENPGAAPSPFTLPAYQLPGVKKAAAMEKAADDEFQAALKAKHTADAHERAAVVLGSAMFFGGIGQAFHNRVRVILSMVSVLALVLGVVQVALLPMLRVGGH